MIYLDNAATTKPNNEGFAFAQTYIEKYFNPSALYGAGIEISGFLKKARENIVSKICSSGYDCIFTSGGTEADNTAIFSFAKRGNVVTTLGEHSAVYETFMQLPSKGVEIRFARLNKDGSVDVEDLLSKIDEKTSFVSIVHVNNETGAINDINTISAKIKNINPKVIFHSDGVQGYGHLPFRLAKTVDLYSVSAHKIGGLKGVGALIKSNKLCVTPILFGGGQEGGIRSGTENVFGIASFYKCADVRFESIAKDYKKVVQLKSAFLSELNKEIAVISSENASPYIISLSCVGLKGEVIQHMLEGEGVLVGTGSACSAKKHNSRVLKECGYSAEVLSGVIRVSFSHETEINDVVIAAKKLNLAYLKLKEIIK